LNAACANSVKIKAPKNGAGVYFNEDCSVAYVLPPATGTIELTAIAKTANLRNCSLLNNAIDTFAKKTDLLYAQMAKIERQNSGSDSGGGFGGGGGLFKPRPGDDEQAPDNSDELLAELEEVLDAYKRSTEKLSDYWSTEGASAQMSYRMEHQLLVNEYRKLNPHVTFHAIQLKDAKIKLARKVGRGDTGTKLPAVLESNIPGFVGITDQQGDIGDAVDAGQAQSGQLVLALTGACPYYDSKRHSFPSSLSAKDLAAHMVANVRYVYELQANKGYKARYNLGAFLRRVQSSEKKGGFFSSKTINKLIVEEETKDWFEIEIYAEDGRIDHDQDFAQTIKAQVIDRALSNIALFVNGDPVAAPTQTQPGPNGASVAAGALRKCPYLYCQAGAAVLDVANAIFGRSESVAEYIRKHDTWVEETVKERRPLTFHGTVEFTAKGG
jgi:hypothetical protein